MTSRPLGIVLGGAALLALSLLGIPLFVGSLGDEERVRGVVVDGRGFGVAGAEVFLFSAATQELVEGARSEEDGDFVFELFAADARVFVRPPEESGLLSAWGAESVDVAGTQAIVLQPARELDVRVLDSGGGPVAGAEVRVYEHRAGAAGVIALAETDALGRAALAAPALADVAVIAPATGLARWQLDSEIGPNGATLRFVLPPATIAEGRVEGADGPLAGVVLLAREGGPSGEWNGFATSDARGRFVLPATDGENSVRALDPSGAHAPARATFDTAQLEPLRVSMARAAPLVVRVSQGGLPLGARVWSWSVESETWSLGARTGASGRATVPAGERCFVRAEPLDPTRPALDAWDVPYDAGSLHLEAKRR